MDAPSLPPELAPALETPTPIERPTVTGFLRQHGLTLALAISLTVIALVGWFLLPPRMVSAVICGNTRGSLYDGFFGTIIAACGGGSAGGGVDCNGLCNCGLDSNGDGVLDLFCGAGQSCYSCCGDPVACPCGGGNLTPVGSHDGKSGTQQYPACTAGGWAKDPDHTSQRVTVRAIVDGTEVASTVANLYRADLTGECAGGNAPSALACGRSFRIMSIIPSRCRRWI